MENQNWKKCFGVLLGDKNMFQIQEANLAVQLIMLLLSLSMASLKCKNAVAQQPIFHILSVYSISKCFGVKKYWSIHNVKKLDILTAND